MLFLQGDNRHNLIIWSFVLILGKKKKLEAAEAEKQEEEDNNAEKQTGSEAYDPTEATDDADIDEDNKNEDIDMEAGMSLCFNNLQCS